MPDGSCGGSQRASSNRSFGRIKRKRHVPNGSFEGIRERYVPNRSCEMIQERVFNRGRERRQRERRVFDRSRGRSQKANV